jgi:acyl-CoA synthetase (AMP-forming)/AMP-acid ligase II
LIEGDRIGFVAPVTQVAGIVWLLASLESGCASIVCDTLDTRRTVEVLAREGVTLPGSDSALDAMYLERQRHQIEPLFPTVRAFVGNGVDRSQDLADELRAVFGVPVLWGYGSTEAPNVTMASATDPDDVLRSTDGAPVHGVELRFVGIDGKLCDPGEVGEIRLRAPQLMSGYQDPALDRTAFDDDGFFCTGDLGFLDVTGNLVVTGRTEEIAVRGDGTIPVKVLEELLRDDLSG